jgi:hypothetical protein
MRSRVSFFMNKFRKMGFIEYNGGLHGEQLAAEHRRAPLTSHDVRNRRPAESACNDVM